MILNPDNTLYEPEIEGYYEFTEDDKIKFRKKIGDFCLLVANKSLDLLELDWELIERDFNKALESMTPDKEDIGKEEYLTSLLDGHMDTIVKTILNVLVTVITEVVLEKKQIIINLPDPVQYAIENRGIYGID